MEKKVGRKGRGGREGPLVVVEGQVLGPDGGRTRRSAILLGLAVFAGAAALILAAGLLSSCAGDATVALRDGGGARLEAKAVFPAPLAAKLRKLAALKDDAPLFDEGRARKAAAGLPGLSLVSMSTPSPDSLLLVLETGELGALLARPDLASSGAAVLSKGQGWTELRIHLERGKIAPLLALFPGLDPDLVDSLSPPALDPDPVSRAEYRLVLSRLLGEKAALALDSATIALRLEAPRAVLASAGGRLSGRTLSLDLPVLDLLVLEKPVDFSLRWKD
jgi:hypothetical protein